MNATRVIEPRQETADVVNWLGNNDLKALGFVGLVELGEATTSQLANALAERAHPDAYSSVRGYPATYAKAGFADVRPDVGSNGRPANYYTATRLAGALPVLGSLLEWSENHDFSLGTMLSVTASKGEASAPVNTLQILDGLASGLSLKQMSLPGYKPKEQGTSTAHNSRLKTLVELGIVETKDEPVAARILDPSYKGSAPLEQLTPGRQGFYHTVRLAKELEPDTQWTLEQLTKLARKRQFIDDASGADFHNALRLAISAGAPRYSPGVFEKQEIQPRAYLLGAQYTSMVHDLIMRVAKVDLSPRYAQQARDYAMDAYNDQATAYRVAERGLTSSAYRKV